MTIWKGVSSLLAAAEAYDSFFDGPVCSCGRVSLFTGGGVLVVVIVVGWVGFGVGFNVVVVEGALVVGAVVVLNLELQASNSVFVGGCFSYQVCLDGENLVELRRVAL